MTDEDQTQPHDEPVLPEDAVEDLSPDENEQNVSGGYLKLEADSSLKL